MPGSCVSGMSASSRAHVPGCGTNTAPKPAARAGMMSDFGLLPIIQACSGRDAEPPRRVGVGGRVLLAHDIDLMEQVAQPRSHDLVPLLVVVALGEQHQAMAPPQVGERVRDVGQQLEPLAAQRRDLGAQEGPQLVERRRRCRRARRAPRETPRSSATRSHGHASAGARWRAAPRGVRSVLTPYSASRVAVRSITESK